MEKCNEECKKKCKKITDNDAVGVTGVEEWSRCNMLRL
jgi:hypothetical protein